MIADGDESDLPTIYVLIHEVQWLRSLYTTYDQLKKQQVMTKNRIYSLLVQNGYHFNKSELHNNDLKNAIMNLELPDTTLFQIEICFENLSHFEKQIEKIKERILYEGRIFETEIDKLVGIDGISVFIAIAIMTDIVNIERFKVAKKMTSYLRTAPTVDSSNNVTKIGPINKHSRKRSLSLLTQGLHHVYKKHEYFIKFYERKRKGKTAGKVRIAVARKLFTMIFQMLKKNEHFKWINKKNHDIKMREYINFLKKKETEMSLKKSA